MSKKLALQMMKLQADIIKQNYYVPLYRDVISRHGVDLVDKINNQEVEDSKIIEICQDFWEALPDSPSIRCAPFFDLCNIAEHIFDDPAEFA